MKVEDTVEILNTNNHRGRSDWEYIGLFNIVRTWNLKIAAIDAEDAILIAQSYAKQEAIEAAYDHLDIYGFPNHPDATLMESQKRVFDLLRPFVKRPKAGQL